jgi:hypothetical protein
MKRNVRPWTGSVEIEIDHYCTGSLKVRASVAALNELKISPDKSDYRAPI